MCVLQPSWATRIHTTTSPTTTWGILGSRRCPASPWCCLWLRSNSPWLWAPSPSAQGRHRTHTYTHQCTPPHTHTHLGIPHRKQVQHTLLPLLSKCLTGNIYKSGLMLLWLLRCSVFVHVLYYFTEHGPSFWTRLCYEIKIKTFLLGYSPAFTVPLTWESVACCWKY